MIMVSNNHRKFQRLQNLMLKNKIQKVKKTIIVHNRYRKVLIKIKMEQIM